jgi:hypothetical protein
MRLQVELGCDDIYLRGVGIGASRCELTFLIGTHTVTIPVARADALAATALVGKKVALHLETWPLPTRAELDAEEPVS